MPPAAAALEDSVRGMIVLQVERNGEAWYIQPDTLHRIFLGRPQDAWDVMRQSGLGVSDANLEKIPVAGSAAVGDLALRRRLAGRILLQVERNGEAWYLWPRTLTRFYLGRPADAFSLMTDLGLGITDADLYRIVSERSLAVPFTSQAPFGLWDFEHDNFCEEASALMVGRYFQGRGIAGPADADAELQWLKDWELKVLGFHTDTNAAETARMIRENYGLTTELQERPTATFIRRMIDEGKPVVVPAAGRLLANPNFRGFGPLYHMFVVVGYTNDGFFIVNEPGTRSGERYRYRQDVVMNAMHDFNGGDVLNGRPVVIVVSN